MNEPINNIERKQNFHQPIQPPEVKKGTLNGRVVNIKTNISNRIQSAIARLIKSALSTLDDIYESYKNVKMKIDSIRLFASDAKSKKLSETIQSPPAPPPSRTQSITNISSHRQVSPLPKKTAVDQKQKSGEIATKMLSYVKSEDYIGKIIQKPEYGMTTYRFKYEGKTYEVNEFTSDAYHGPQTEDFLDRQDLLRQAAEKVCGEDPKKQEALKKLNEDFKTQLKYNGNLNPEMMKQRDELAGSYFDGVHAEAEKMIAQYARDAQTILDCSLEDIQNTEKEIVLERGRPTIINQFEVEGKKFVSMQTPASEEVIPSSIQDKQGLANFVNTSTGTVDANGNVTITFEGTRHSRYPPVAIEDRELRSAYAAQNVRQALTDLAEKMDIDPETNSKQNPATVQLRTMMLLTAKKGDFVRNWQGIGGKWTGESETTQLEDSINALNLFRDRTFPITMNGKEIWIKADISALNQGANIHATNKFIMGRESLADSRVHNTTNNRGYSEFEADLQNFYHSLDNQIPQTTEFEEIQKVRKELDTPDEKVAAKMKEIEEYKNNNKEALASLNEELYSQLEKCTAPPSKQLKRDIAATEKEIESLNRPLDRLYAQLMDLKKQAYLRDADKIDKNVQTLKKLIASLNKNPEQENLIDRLEKETDVRVNHLQANELFYTGKSLLPDRIMDLQAIYIETQSKLNHSVEFFCKSGEDRTGNMDNQIIARNIFYSLYGYEPQSEEDRKVLKEKIMPKVFEFSANQNNTRENSNARGLQITSKVNQELGLADAGKKMGGLAKSVFKKAKKLPPSDFALNLIQSSERKESAT